MRKLFFIILLFLLHKSYAQDSIPKTNPIVFIELTVGYGGSLGEYSGPILGGTANFQSKKDLFTFRYIENPQLIYTNANVGFLALPILESKFSNREFALMYGKRYINNSVSYSFSGGISSNTFKEKLRTEDRNVYINNTIHYGFAYELNVKWFNSKKERYRIYMIAPIGKPTSFGRSFGFKLVGNISEHSYIGIGMSYGFGWHKNY